MQNDKQKVILKQLNKYILIIMFTVLLLSLYTVKPTLAKYVINTVSYNISIGSAMKIPLKAVTIAGLPQADRVLTASLTPSGAAASYQWQSCAAYDGTFTDIIGATQSTYTTSINDLNKYIRVMATGTADYTGTVISAVTSKISEAAFVTLTGTDTTVIIDSALGSFISEDLTITNATGNPIHLIKVVVSYSRGNNSAGNLSLIFNYLGATTPVPPVSLIKDGPPAEFTIAVSPGITDLDIFSLNFDSTINSSQLDSVTIHSLRFIVLS
ncbi:MAG: hypothetical protein ACYCWE_15800 [Eubacteriales bacterium]